MKSSSDESDDEFDSSCRSNPGETYVTIGQDLFSIQNYVSAQYNVTLHDTASAAAAAAAAAAAFGLASVIPAAVMVYTDIQTLNGLYTPTDYGSGVEFANGILELFSIKPVGLQVGLWLNGTQGCQDIVQGQLDDNIQRMIEYFMESCPSPKIFLRVGYEFDNPYFGYLDDPQAYKQAFRTIVDTCQEMYPTTCRKKIAFVWHSWAASPVPNMEQFYPGKHHVDWIGISLFQQVYPKQPQDELNNGDFSGGTMDHVKFVLDFAQQQDKPIMIAESAPFGGITASQNPHINNDTDIWEAWFEPILTLIQDYDIGMWSYIDCDWESQPMWYQVGFGDTRLKSNTFVMEQWYQNIMTNKNQFSQDLTCMYQDTHNHDHPKHNDHKDSHDHKKHAHEHKKEGSSDPHDHDHKKHSHEHKKESSNDSHTHDHEAETHQHDHTNNPKNHTHDFKNLPPIKQFLYNPFSLSGRTVSSLSNSDAVNDTDDLYTSTDYNEQKTLMVGILLLIILIAASTCFKSYFCPDNTAAQNDSDDETVTLSQDFKDDPSSRYGSIQSRAIPTGQGGGGTAVATIDEERATAEPEASLSSLVEKPDIDRRKKRKSSIKGYTDDYSYSYDDYD